MLSRAYKKYVDIVYSGFIELIVKPRRPTFLKALPLFEDVAQAEVFHFQVFIHAVAGSFATEA